MTSYSEAQFFVQPPNERTASDTARVARTLTRRFLALRDLTTEELVELVNGATLLKLKEQSLVFREGELATGSSLINPKATVGNKLASAREAKSARPGTKALRGTQSVVTKGGGTGGISLFGQLWSTCKAGALFGDLDMVSEPNKRSVTALVDDPSDILHISQVTFQRFMARASRTRYVELSGLVVEHPYFRECTGAERALLMLVLREEKVGHGEVLVKQGAPFTALHFIMSGEVALMVDPDKHLAPTESNSTKEELDADGVNIPTNIYRGRSRKVPLIPTTLLNKHEIIGDVEAMLSLDAYVHTAVCTQTARLLVLDLPQYIHFIGQKQCHVTDLAMRSCVEARLAFRCKQLALTFDPFTPSAPNAEPLKALTPSERAAAIYRMALNQLMLGESDEMDQYKMEKAEGEKSLRGKSAGRRITASREAWGPGGAGGSGGGAPGGIASWGKTPSSKEIAASAYKTFNKTTSLWFNHSSDKEIQPVRVGDRTLADFYRPYIPSQGLLVDQWGPGTVFARTRRRNERLLQRRRLGLVEEALLAGSAADREETEVRPGGLRRTRVGEWKRERERQAVLDSIVQ